MLEDAVQRQGGMRWAGTEGWEAAGGSVENGRPDNGVSTGAPIQWIVERITGECRREVRGCGEAPDPAGFKLQDRQDGQKMPTEGA